MVRAVGARANVPEGFDQWELWPNDTLLRANLASEAYQLGHLSPWAVAAAQAKTAVVSAMPTWTPLKRAVLGFALQLRRRPVRLGRHLARPAERVRRERRRRVRLLRVRVVGHEDADLHRRRAHVERQHRHRPAAHDLPDVAGGQARRAASRAPACTPATSSSGARRRTACTRRGGRSTTPASTSGNDWTINSHGSGDGVTLDYMGPGAGWYHDAFAFGWRIMPMHK